MLSPLLTFHPGCKVLFQRLQVLFNAVQVLLERIEPGYGLRPLSDIFWCCVWKLAGIHVGRVATYGKLF